MITSTSIKFPGTGKNLENKRQKGKTHKTLRDLSCVTASTSKGTFECILPLCITVIYHNIPLI